MGGLLQMHAYLMNHMTKKKQLKLRHRHEETRVQSFRLDAFTCCQVRRSSSVSRELTLYRALIQTPGNMTLPGPRLCFILSLDILRD